VDSVLRAAAVYLFLLVVFRIAGKRALAQITTFDLVLLLIIGEATQQALLGEDFSVTNAYVVIATLVVMERGFSILGAKYPAVDRVLESVPVVVAADGRLLAHARREDVTEAEVLEAARHLHGLERMDQIKFAVLERSGGISIIPRG
jgi:uncharacterized membrane protein YcaP (DUF421 family)